MDDAIIQWLHPVARPYFRDAIHKAEKVGARPFSGFRSPEAQEAAKAAGNSQVGAWRSVHQYGCAVDFAKYDEQSKWSWPDRTDQFWRTLDNAIRGDIISPIHWDPGHFVLVGWRDRITTWLKQSTFT